MLAGAGLGDDALLAHAARHHDLAEHIVDLVRAGVVELLALEVDFCAAEMLGQAFGEIKRRRPADIILEIAVHFSLERRIGLGVGIGLFQVEDQRHQRFRDKAAAEIAEMPALVGTAAEGVGQGFWLTWIHRTINSSVARAARMKSRIISGSLTPGERSTPEDTSTPPARVTRTASATLPASSPPETMNGSLRSSFSSRCQSNTAPSPPGRVASLGARASNRMRSATAAYPASGARSAAV